MEFINLETLQHVVSKMLNKPVVELTYETKMLHGGTVGQVYLVQGQATTVEGVSLPYQLVLKIQKKYTKNLLIVPKHDT